MPKTILITGGSEGLGLALATRLSKDNNVVILSLDENKLKKISQELNCTSVTADVSNWDQVNDAVSKIIKRFGQIDVLINNAGVYINGPLNENDISKIKNVIDVNVLGLIQTTKAVVFYMKKKKSGVIINISSQSGLKSAPNKSVYRASKWAVTGFTKCIQEELAPFGIRVTGIYPGLLKTSFFTKADPGRSLENALDTDEVAKTIEFILNSKDKTLFSEIGLKHLDYF